MLTTLERAKKLLSIPTDDISQDGQIMILLGVASERIEKHCKRSFRIQEHIEQLSGPRSKYIMLRNYPVHEVIQLNGPKGPISDFLILDDGMMFRRDGWPEGQYNLTVKYIGGYVLPGDATPDRPATLPQPIEYACVLFTQTMMRAPEVTAERVGDISVTYANPGEDMPGAVKALIAPYVGRWV